MEYSVLIGALDILSDTFVKQCLLKNGARCKEQCILKYLECDIELSVEACIDYGVI